MVKLKKRASAKQFSGYIDGDDELRKQIFKYKPASQQIIFELFSYLDTVYYSFFQLLCALPSTAFWDLITAKLSASQSVTDRNRNFCDDYTILDPVIEEQSKYTIHKPKVINLLGAAHGIWFHLAADDYCEAPNTLGLWRSFYNINPSRVIWEWWLQARYTEATTLYNDYKSEWSETYAINKLEDWAQESFGLLKPRSHAWSLYSALVEACSTVLNIKNKIANPYLRLVYSLAKGIAAYNQPDQFPDTYAIGVTGLMRGIAKYAPSMSLAFPSFVEKEIRYEIYYQLSNYNVIALPHQTWQKYRKFEEMRSDHYSQHGKEISVQDFIKKYHLDKEEVYTTYAHICMQNTTSLEQNLYLDDDPNVVDLTLKDRLEDPLVKELSELLEDQELLLLTLKHLPINTKKYFVFSYNLCELIHDEVKPCPDELTAFFINQAPCPTQA